MLFGAAIGSSVKNAPLAVILALLGHYFLDLFPHIEYLDGVENSITKLKSAERSKKIKDLVKVFLDFCLGILLIFLFSRNFPIIYLCAFIAIVPDGLTVIHSLFPKLGLTLHHYIHGTTIHYLTKQKNFPVYWKILTQVIVVIVSVILLKI
ncbi:MAG: hypothetical protein EXS52_01885 [Candidatus Staskawiczbacteria bacterium]|nr:hypothetical protein [Candidatus Staskawiczbacteria bacterium]